MSNVYETNHSVFKNCATFLNFSTLLGCLDPLPNTIIIGMLTKNLPFLSWLVKKKVSFNSTRESIFSKTQTFYIIVTFSWRYKILLIDNATITVPLNIKLVLGRTKIQLRNPSWKYSICMSIAGRGLG
jgi:hypothetical protein